MSVSLQNRIRERAYEIWSATGRVHGQAEQHWVAAERQLLSELARQSNFQIIHTIEQIKPAPVRSGRLLTNVRPQPKKAARG